jgi:hypothetical protein
MSMHELGRYARYCSVLRQSSACSVLLGMRYLALVVALSVIKNDMSLNVRRAA